jgi:hypothetical protein
MSEQVDVDLKELKTTIIRELERVQTFKGPTDLPLMIHKSMEIVDKYLFLSGPEKKELVIEVVTQFVDNTDFCDPLLPLIPVLIEEFIDISNGTLILNKKSKFCPCLRYF